MNCPYCGKKVSSDLLYCPSCGQQLNNVNNSNLLYEEYWENIKQENIKYVRESVDIEKKCIMEQNLRRRKSLFGVASVATIVLFILLALYSVNKNNQAKLIRYHRSMIGNTYSDNSRKQFMMGSPVERTIIDIIDNNTLSYTSGTYIARQNDSGYGFYWIESNVSDTRTYDYILTIGTLGNVKISFDDKSYRVHIEDDKVVDIDCYD